MSDPRWTEDAAALVAKAVRKGFVPFGDPSFNPRLEATAEVVLTALADVGLLMPAGAEAREKWAVQSPGWTPGGDGYRILCKSEEEARTWQADAPGELVLIRRTAILTPFTEVETGSQS